jgi:hypothetical protein
VNKRVNEASRTSFVQKTAQINAELAKAKDIIAFETEKAMANMKMVATEKEYGEWGKQIADAKAAANGAMPMIGQLKALWAQAQPEFERQLRGNPDYLVQLGESSFARSQQPEAIRKYLDLLDAARPKLARLMGNVGAFTEQEQARGGFLVPGPLDAANKGRTGDDKFRRIETLFMAAPSIAQRQRPGSKPLTAAEMDQILKSWQPALPGDKALTTPPIDLMVTPDGLQRPGGRQ